MTVLTPEFDKAVQAPEVDKNWPQTGHVLVAKKCGGWLWGGQRIREILDDFASRGRIRGLRFANFFDTVSPRRKRNDVTRANRDGSNHSAFIGKFERALNSTLDVGKRVPPYMWVFPRPQSFFDKTACGQERKCAYFSRQSANSGEIVHAPRERP